MPRHLATGLLVSAALLASATAAAQSGSAGAGNDDGTSGIVILGASADLSVTSKGVASNEAGGPSLVYTIVVANAGPGAAANVRFTNEVPRRTTFTSLDAPAGWRCSTPPPEGTGTVTCSRPLVPMGESARFTLVVAVCADAQAAAIVNVATVSAPTSDPLRGNNTATVAITTPVSLQSFGVD